MSHNKSSDDQIAIIIRFAGKMSNMQVAEIAGVSESTVRKYIADYGLKPANCRPGPRRKLPKPKYTVLQLAISKPWQMIAGGVK